MEICAKPLRFLLLVCLFTVTGCSDFGTSTSETKPVQNSSLKGREPIAVISIAPGEDWISDLQGMSSNKFAFWGIGFDQIANQLPGVDLQQSITVLLYPSKRQVVQPIMYLPVADYDQFLKGLSKRVRLHRAVASSFMVGSQKILIKQVGDFAVFGTSLNHVNAAPTSPDVFRDQLPSEADLAIKVNADSLRASEKQKIAQLFTDCLGDSMEPFKFEAGSIVLGLSIDSKTGIQLQTQLSPLPNEPQQFQQSLKEAMDKRGLPLTSEISGNKLVIHLEFKADQLNTAWSQLGTTLVDSLRAQQKTLVQRVSNSSRAPLPKITYINSGFNASSSQSSCSSGGSGGGRRRGGG